MVLPQWFWPAVIAGGVVVIGGIWWFFFRTKAPTAQVKDVSQTTNRSLELWFRPGCPPCKDFEPVWAEFKKLYGNVIELKEFSVLEDRDTAIARGIKGTPTVVMVYENGETDIFSGDRSVPALASWAGLGASGSASGGNANRAT